QIVRTLGDTSSLTFTFSEAVDVNSILPFNIFGQTIDYTFTPTGGSNSPVVVSITGGAAPGEVPVDLNWTGVTSFAVSAPGAAAFAFDDVSVNPTIITLAVNDEYAFQKAQVYPNPVENMLNIKHVSDLISIKVYNNLGEQVLQSKTNRIDVSHLSKGLYILKIKTSQGTETKKIIKK
ncbi:T9SS type A sorting domain-containing protein, partial [Flavivirga aquimarina]